MSEGEKFVPNGASPIKRNAEERFHQDNVPAARRLRREETATEQQLWECLRGRRCLNLKFRRQHPFGRFVVDFYCEEIRVAIEIDGSYHLDPEQKARDNERQGLLEEQGIRFIRIPADLVAGDRTSAMRHLTAILSALV